jgi:hypothetical protein
VHFNPLHKRVVVLFYVRFSQLFVLLQVFLLVDLLELSFLLGFCVGETSPHSGGDIVALKLNSTLKSLDALFHKTTFCKYRTKSRPGFCIFQIDSRGDIYIFYGVFKVP